MEAVSPCHAILRVRAQLIACAQKVWTRFQPYAYKLQEVLASGAIVRST